MFVRRKKKCLHDEVLQLELAGLDLLVNPLVARIESPRVAAHRDKAGLFLNGENLFGVGKRIGNRNLDLDVLSGAHALDRLLGMHLRRGGQDDGFDAGPGRAPHRNWWSSAGSRIFRRRLLWSPRFGRGSSPPPRL